jgi:hypothetical protein
MTELDDTETSVDITDAGSPAPAAFTGSHLDQARQASDEYERRKGEGESFGGEPDVRIDLAELGDDHPDKIVKHRARSQDPVTASEAARELEHEQELRKDRTYSKTVDLLDKLVESGSDKEEAQIDYKRAIVEAEQRLAARRMGLFDEQPNEAPAEQQPTEQPAERPTEQPQQPQQPQIRLPEIEAAAARLIGQYVQEFGVHRALTSDEIATLTPEQAGRYVQYNQTADLGGPRLRCSVRAAVAVIALPRGIFDHVANYGGDGSGLIRLSGATT